MMFDEVAQRPLRVEPTAFINQFRVVDALGEYVGNITLANKYDAAITRPMAETMVAWINQGVVEPPANWEPPYVISTSQNPRGRWSFNLHMSGTVRTSNVTFDTQTDARLAAERLTADSWLAAVTLVHAPDQGVFQGEERG